MITRRRFVAARRIRAAARRLRQARPQPELPRRAALGRRTDDAQPPADRRPQRPGSRISSAADMSPMFRTNGNMRCRTRPTMRGTWPSNFANWRLVVDGLVARPLAIPLADASGDADAHADHPPRLRRGLERDRQMDRRAARRACSRMPGCSTRAQIYRLPLRRRFRRHWPYYESIDLVDAFHPQTILAWGMNDAAAAGRPTARRCGCGSSASSATSTPSTLCGSRRSRALRESYRGKGGYWEDSTDYQWYAGI